MKKIILHLLFFCITYGAFAQESITLGTLPSSNYCIQNQISVPFTTNIPFGTQFTVKLKRENIVVATQTGFSSPIIIYTNLAQDITFSNNYVVEIVTNNITSGNSPFFSIGNIIQAYVSDGLNKRINSPDEVCNSKSKVYFATVKGKNGEFITENLTIQWKKNGVDILNANGLSLTVSEQGQYSFSLIQAGCSILSSSVGFQFHNYSFKSYNVFVDGDKTACVGTIKNLSVAYATTTAQYEWTKNGTVINNSNFRTFPVTESGEYNVNITESNCSMGGAPTKINFSTSINAIAFPMFGDTTICGGNYIELRANYNEEIPNQYSYQWQKDNENITNTVSNKYKFSPNTSGKYRVIYQQGNCISKSDEIIIIASNKAQKPELTIGNQFEVCQGSIFISTSPNNFAKHIYQTQENSIGLSDIMGGRYFKDGIEMNPGSYSSTRYITQPGTYTMLYGQGNCEILSNPLTINFNPQPFSPKIFAENNKTILCGPDYVYLKFDTPNVGNTYSYQWKRNGINITNGGTSSTYFAQIAGDYTVLVTNGSCSGTSNLISVTSNNYPNFNLVSNKNNIFCSNQLFKLNSPYSKTTIWTLNDVVIPNENKNYLYANQAGIYKAKINAGECFAESLPFNLEINIPTEIFTTKSGNWTDPTCWICNILPNFGSNATISNGHNILVPLGIHEVKNIKLEGTVNFEEGGEIRVHGWN